jgi:cytochrome c-type biogenesis protein CcmH/NrfG
MEQFLHKSKAGSKSKNTGIAMNINDVLKLLKRNPTDQMAWLTLGDILVDTGDIWQAMDCYDRAMKLDPELKRSKPPLAARYAIEAATLPTWFELQAV